MEYLTIKSYSKKSFDEFYNVFERNNRIEDKVIFDSFKVGSLEIIFYKNLTICFKGKINEYIIKKMDVLVDKNLYIGIDEVGIGENVGPLIVSAFKFNSIEDKKKALLIGVRDSKKLNILKINKIAKELKKLGTNELIILTPNKFNFLWNKEINAKAINAIMQNNLILKIKDGKEIIIDKFVEEKKFFEYLKKYSKKINKEKINFIEKSEDKFLEVAAASIIAKHEFNKYLINYLNENNIIIKEKLTSNIIWKKIKEGAIKKDDSFIKEWGKNLLDK